MCIRDSCGTEACDVDCGAMADCVVDALGDTNVACSTNSTCDVTTAGDNADLDCEMGSMCAFEAMGADNTINCDSGATCTVTSGRDGDVLCSDATCTVTVADEGDVECEMGATCTVTCEADCTVLCRDTSMCMVQCPGETEPSPTEGEHTCVAG